MSPRPEPRQPHFKAIWDEYMGVGRTDVTDLIVKVLSKQSAATLMYPDLYAHKITEALIGADLLGEEEQDV